MDINILESAEKMNNLTKRKRGEELNQQYMKKICAVACVGVGLWLWSSRNERKEREANVHRARAEVVTKIAAMKDITFKRHYRLDRESFMRILNAIEPQITPSAKGMSMAKVSSGSHIPAVIQLAVTLRLLAGGSYLDLAFAYNVEEKYIFTVFHRVLRALDQVLDNISFPYDDETALLNLEQTFSNISKGCFPGTVLAGDGVVFKMTKPLQEEVDGNVRSFYTRKGFYAVGLQAFVDGNCKFRHISMKTCSSTHDGTAYIMTGIHQIIREGKLPSWAHIVLDEAYTCSNQELTPWRGRNLPPDKDKFNYYLSLHRQVVERAFGLLVSRWGIFWRPLRFGVQKNNLIIQVCCKLHNVCVDVFGTRKTSVETTLLDRFWVRGHGSDLDDTVLWTDGTSIRRGTRTDLNVSNTREQLTNHLFTSGLTRPPHSMSKKIARIKDKQSSTQNI